MRGENNSDAKFLSSMCQEYIDSIDYLRVASIFAGYDDYELNELKFLCDIPENSVHIQSARSYLQDYLFESDVIRKSTGSRDKTRNELLESFNKQMEEQEKACLYHLLKLAFVIAFYRRLDVRYDSKPLEISALEDLEHSRKGVYFRGQSNYMFRVSPSIIRNLNESVLLNDDYYHKILKDEIGLEDKFNNLIRKDNAWMNRYNKYAFMQHSCSYSPLVDFTKEPIVATSFALSNTSRVNDFRNEDSAVFCLINSRENLDVINHRWEARDFLVNEFYLQVIDAKEIKLGKDYVLRKADGFSKALRFNSIDKLLDALTPEIKIIDITTNDRMLYQSGVFVCFYDCVCLRDFIAYELNPAFVLKKIRIHKRNKKSILNSIYKNHREYDPEHLMNPYLYFNE